MPFPSPPTSPAVPSGALQGLQSAQPQDSSPMDDSGAMMQVPQHDIYQDASKGPFMCSNCQHFMAPDQCNQPFIVQLQGPQVEPSACCDLFDSLSVSTQGGSPSLSSSATAAPSPTR